MKLKVFAIMPENIQILPHRTTPKRIFGRPPLWPWDIQLNFFIFIKNFGP